MSALDDWSKKQTEPLGVFDLANKWSEALKVVGAGNGAGLVAAGAALSAFAKYPAVLLFIKIGGACFFVGVVTFALGFASIQLAIFTYDEMLHARRKNDAAQVAEQGATSSSAMNAANRLAIISALSFLVGLAVGLVAFLAV